MSLGAAVRALSPEWAMSWLRRQRKQLRKRRVAARPPITADVLHSILTDQLGLVDGDTVFVHSGLGELNLHLPPAEILAVLRSVIGSAGTMLFPTYPPVAAYDFLVAGEVFDVRNSTSHTGLLTELARTHRDAVRSLHPTKSVAAIGRRALELIDDHPASPYPYDANSPYARIMALQGKVIGIGVATKNLSFVHCVDDALKDEFPVQPYHDRLFAARCIDYNGQEQTVPTYAHDMAKIHFDVPGFMQEHVAPDVCEDLVICGAPFFRAASVPLFHRLTELARDGVTIYPPHAYKSRSAVLEARAQ